MPSTQVTTIVITRNSERFLRQALDSLFAQSYRPSEILVVDGQSTDKTLEIAESYDSVRVVLQQTLGLARARNLGIEAAKGRLIAFLDSDDVWHPQKLEKQVDYLEAHPDTDYTLVRLQFVGSEAGEREPVEAATPSALVARASVFERLGQFDPDFTIGTDADWFTRARDAGLVCHTIPEVLLDKRLHTKNISHDWATNRREMIEIARRSIARQREKS